jgi:hypothetical protein
MARSFENQRKIESKPQELARELAERCCKSRLRASN